VGEVRRVVCASPAYLAEHGTPQGPDDLAAHTIVRAGGLSNENGWTMRQDGQLRVVKLQPRLFTTTNDSALAAAESGFGLTRLLSYQVADAVAAGRLCIVLAEHEPPPLPVHVVHREGRHAVQRVRAFLDLAIDRLRRLEDAAPA
jgi:DNA-binding transcriptional LysR family regulator